MALPTLDFQYFEDMLNLRIAHVVEIWGNRLRFLINHGLRVEPILQYSVEELINEPEELTEWWKKNRDEAFRRKAELKEDIIKPEPPSPRIIKEDFRRPEWWDNFVEWYKKRF